MLIIGIFQQLFAPRRTTEKPIVGAQVFKMKVVLSLTGYARIIGLFIYLKKVKVACK